MRAVGLSGSAASGDDKEFRTTWDAEAEGPRLKCYF